MFLISLLDICISKEIYFSNKHKGNQKLQILFGIICGVTVLILVTRGKHNPWGDGRPC